MCFLILVINLPAAGGKFFEILVVFYAENTFRIRSGRCFCVYLIRKSTGGTRASFKKFLTIELTTNTIFMDYYPLVEICQKNQWDLNQPLIFPILKGSSSKMWILIFYFFLRHLVCLYPLPKARSQSKTPSCQTIHLLLSIFTKNVPWKNNTFVCFMFL